VLKKTPAAVFFSLPTSETPQAGKIPSTLTFANEDSSLELRDQTGTVVLWKDGPQEKDGLRPKDATQFELRDDGTAVMCLDGDKPFDIIWALPGCLGDRLRTLQLLYSKQYLQSPNGTYTLSLELSGDMVFAKNRTDTLWTLKTFTTNKVARLTLRSDGNLELREGRQVGSKHEPLTSAHVLYSSSLPTQVGQERVLLVQSNGEVGIYDGAGTKLLNLLDQTKHR
jgi:hypothetical protein